MASILSRVSEMARGPRGRDLATRAKREVQDPTSRRKLEAAVRERVHKRR